MNQAKLEKLTLFNELAMRTNANYARLETWRYWPETIFEMDQHAWPADWEGRTMLALTMHAQTTCRVPAFLDDILEATLARLNDKGYIGPVYPEGVTHEQAMAGHSWMLRALVEYYTWKKDKDTVQATKALKILNSIVEGLYIPQADNYKRYPIDLETRDQDSNWILSHKQSKTKSHAGSSDCGCAFIAIDGATAAYELTGNVALRPLIENMIASYAALPREELHVQTHATLSGVRGVLRYYRITREQNYLDLAIRTFDSYKEKAWTGHYANYNWFGVPRWTEACAVIDSFIISQELWELTAEEGYLRDAHHILYNAIAHAQRSNGSFGTDQCVGSKVKPPTEMWGADTYESDQAVIFAKAQTYEVYWCCNMRGGDGLARAQMYSFYTDGNTVVLPHFHSGETELELENGLLKLREETNYPFTGKVRLHVMENTAGPVILKFFAPNEWSSGINATLSVNGKKLTTSYADGFIQSEVDLNPGDTVLFETEMKVRVVMGSECINNSKEHFSFRHGPMLLGIKQQIEDVASDAEERFIAPEAELKPVAEGYYETADIFGNPTKLGPMWGKENLIEPLDVFQVLFKKERKVLS